MISGINANTFRSKASNYQILADTIAASMTGITRGNIKGLTVTDASSNRRRLGSSQHPHRVLQQATIRAAYTITANSIYSTAQLLDELTTAVTSGAFTSNLNTNAAAAGPNDMAGTSSMGFVDTSSKDKKLSDGAIAGIVIGCFVFVALVAPGFIRKLKSAAPATPAAP